MKIITVQYQIGVINIPDFVNVNIKKKLEAIPEPFFGYTSNTQ